MNVTEHTVNTSRKLVIYGAGDHGQVVADAAIASGWDLLGFLDDRRSIRQVGLWPLIDESVLEDPQIHVLVAVGNNMARRELCERLFERDIALATVVHPTAWISPSAKLGAGVYIGPQAAINMGAAIEDGAIINTGAVVEHHCHIGAYAHLAPRVALGGRVVVGSECLIGIGTSVCPSVHIGDGCTVGAGTVVIRDVVAHQTVVGVPARPLREMAAQP